ncbi:MULTISPECIES: thiolase family protein [Desulfitobacterium]|uniref:Acetyl-CoA acetyltransferase n=1 Tax=Desulfitobacterium dehalogenans (strain ATCC 51507 / DSM 9161 / JW/IU-DC1) TaxID=756499 RepID=I4ABE6_DESDJ|nr:MULTISPECIES: thiolase family protein [Desulfitobacterium]AFM01281.1 acetyl-CoA acetyltransferase [Desulfitobacterium dehalogenans ATCC 51507]
MHEVVIVSGMRTPIGDFNGMLKDFRAVDLGIVALKGALEKAKLEPSQIEEVIAGQVYQAGCKGNTARQVAMGVGCPVETVAATINQQCPSSMRAMEMVSQEIMLGKIHMGAAVGIESMTNVPYLLLKARGGYRMGSDTLYDGLLYDALIDAFYDYHVGVTAENLADLYSISREEQDEFAVESHRRACQAIQEGKFKEEIVPVELVTKKETKIFTEDEHPRSDATLDGLTKLRPAFKKEGTVTAGNASSLSDGGAALILMSREKAEELGLKPLARIVATASASVDPKFMGIGVVPAVKRALQYAGMSIGDIDLWEINEAFAAQVLACNRELKLDLNKLNVNGSGVSLGHPVGMTGARLILTLIQEMKRRKNQFGCASLCAGGGPAMAVIIEALA